MVAGSLVQCGLDGDSPNRTHKFWIGNARSLMRVMSDLDTGGAYNLSQFQRAFSPKREGQPFK